MESEKSGKAGAARWVAGIFTAVFLALSVASGIYGLMRNSLCFSYLGCNVGFFGFDALLHFVSGVAIASGLIWVFKTSGSHMLAGRSFWARVLVVLAFAALIAVLWEMLEYAYDYVRIAFLHMDLANPNMMAQPSNSDTMGDITLSLVASLVTAIAIW